MSVATVGGHQAGEDQAPPEFLQNPELPAAGPEALPVRVGADGQARMPAVDLDRYEVASQAGSVESNQLPDLLREETSGSPRSNPGTGDDPRPSTEGSAAASSDVRSLTDSVIRALGDFPASGSFTGPQLGIARNLRNM